MRYDDVREQFANNTVKCVSVEICLLIHLIQSQIHIDVIFEGNILNQLIEERNEAENSIIIKIFIKVRC
jgi:hypothetical protein